MANIRYLVDATADHLQSFLPFEHKFLNGLNHSSRSLAIPEINFASLRRLPGKHIRHVIFEIIKGAQAVGALVDGDGAFGMYNNGLSPRLLF